MKVLVAGYPKTGTKTMSAALSRLGYEVCDVFDNYHTKQDDWTRIIKDGWTVDDFKRMYEGVDAVVDAPACYFWEELYRAFPEAKIILTVRKNEDVWVDSLLKFHTDVLDSGFLFTLLHSLSPTYLKGMKNIRIPIASIMYGTKRTMRKSLYNPNRCLLKMKYRAHNAHVLQNAPADKLLVFNCTEGWGPLCNFLEVPVPDEPFPRKNVAGQADAYWTTHPTIRKIRREILTSAVCIITAFLFLMALVMVCEIHEYRLGMS